MLGAILDGLGGPSRPQRGDRVLPESLPDESLRENVRIRGENERFLVALGALLGLPGGQKSIVFG